MLEQLKPSRSALAQPRLGSVARQSRSIPELSRLARAPVLKLEPAEPKRWARENSRDWARLRARVLVLAPLRVLVPGPAFARRLPNDPPR